MPYFRRKESRRSPVYAARAATVVFGALMVVVATLAAYAVLQDSKLTIIPLALAKFRVRLRFAAGRLFARDADQAKRSRRDQSSSNDVRHRLRVSVLQS